MTSVDERYDRERKDWRLFSIDRFLTKSVRTGMCPAERTVPEPGRLWQKDQVVERSGDGSAKMTFAVYDMDEVIRWAFGFGTDATIVAPDATVERAREISSSLASVYANGVLKI